MSRISELSEAQTEIVLQKALPNVSFPGVAAVDGNSQAVLECTSNAVYITTASSTSEGL